MSRSDENHMLTASFFIQLVQQGHAASAMEKYYLAWKLLKAEMAMSFSKRLNMMAG
jgi:hypothetical protein